MYFCRMYKAQVQNKVIEVVKEGAAFKINGKEFPADILEFKKDRFHILLNNRSFSAEIVEVNTDEKKVYLKVNNTFYSVEVKDQYDVLLKEMGIDSAAGPKVNDIKAPMPGLVLNVLVANGQPVQKGDAILVLEAMKMENILKAPADGIIKKVHVLKGDKVEKNQVMINLV